MHRDDSAELMAEPEVPGYLSEPRDSKESLGPGTG